MGMVLRTNLGIIQDCLILLVVGSCCSWFLPQPEKQNHFIVIVVICCKVVRFMDQCDAVCSLFMGQCDAVCCFRCVSFFPF